ncbi:homocysteine S-methyltransferase family protein [Phaeobacter sp. 22II1-1F12B]|uniref:homocysteine S-methyltransferase family protein n=1 Tax=Phaeobacter sp. 22II1-1F12B TaxID=1317111 RepID=UPI000B5218CD|nr:homocysteine S-methyltransferase family protein [Phaeobacter sp. 22II1-1F12B]OWU79305.1 homocysteine methyltransferase [Phaeobacter sp. 22II1-1F12B]
MAMYRHDLPQLKDEIFLTDSGLETHLIFNEGYDLPLFASYTLLETDKGRDSLRAYYRQHLAIAKKHDTGFILEAPTWRASRDWGEQIGHCPADLERLNRRAISMLADLRKESSFGQPIVISGNLGPRGDGYRPDLAMTARESEAYHEEQIGWFAQTEADMIAAFTLSTVAEAVGIIRASEKVGMPCVPSFTVETDGNLPDGTPLREAILSADAETGSSAAYFMVNCAHPDHFRDRLTGDKSWLQRIGGIRANASRLSHAELDEAEELDPGNPEELGRDYAELRRLLPRAQVLGGCCGTDHRHVTCIAASNLSAVPA